VISNVNCRIQWIIESLNASCAPWHSEEHACLSVIKLSKHFFCWSVLDFGSTVLVSFVLDPALLKSINFGEPSVWYIILFIRWLSPFKNAPLTSNQVGLPAELKHINKRRKRN